MKSRQSAKPATHDGNIGVPAAPVLPEKPHRPAAIAQHAGGLSVVDQLNWDDLRLVLAAVRAGSLRRTAGSLGKDIATVVRRVRRLEEQLGEQLFQIFPNGVRPTPTGQAIAAAAERIEAIFFDLARDLVGAAAQQGGVVRIAITEGLGTYWVMPKLVEFQRAFPRLTVELRCAMESVDVLRHEADIAIQFIRPDSPDLIVTKLGRLHIYPFASRDYQRIYGLPQSIADLGSHRVIDQVAPQLAGGVAPHLAAVAAPEHLVTIRTNASTALLYAIEKGAGIGGLPTYAIALGADVIPVDIGIKHHLDIWLTYHPSLREVERIATVVSWLRRIFSPEHYLWFRDEFVHPSALKEMLDREPEASTARNYRAAMLK